MTSFRKFSFLVVAYLKKKKKKNWRRNIKAETREKDDKLYSILAIFTT